MKITIGRGIEGEQKIDLTPYRYEGVSRIHCTIERIDANTVEIIDKSHFGTYLCKDNIAERIPKWNPQTSNPPTGLVKVNGSARANINDVLFLGPTVHAPIKNWLVRKDGSTLQYQRTPANSEDSFTRIILNKPETATSFDLKKLNEINSIGEMRQKFGSQVADIRKLLEQNNRSGIAPYIYPIILSVCAEQEIEAYRIPEAQKDLYKAGDMMYEIARQGHPAMEAIYADILVILIKLYKKVFAAQAMQETKEAAIKIYKHLGDTEKLMAVKTM